MSIYKCSHRKLNFLHRLSAEKSSPYLIYIDSKEKRHIYICFNHLSRRGTRIEESNELVKVISALSVYVMLSTATISIGHLFTAVLQGAFTQEIKISELVDGLEPVIDFMNVGVVKLIGPFSYGKIGTVSK